MAIEELVALVRRRRGIKDALLALRGPSNKCHVFSSEIERDEWEASVIELEREELATEFAIDHYRCTGTFLEGQCQ